jgi:hypothetical protein
MIADKRALLEIIDRIETGIINETDVATLRGVVERLDEMDDLVDTVCSCRTSEIPIIKDAHIMRDRKDV